MNKTIGGQLLVYSLLLAGLSYAVYQSAPVPGKNTLITGLAGGALCLVWGIRALAGSPGKALPLLTLIPICFVLLSQTVFAWGGGSQESLTRTAAIIITILFVLSITMLMRIAYAGALLSPQSGATGNATADSKNKSTGRKL
jgi:preprotein translocase subunit SecG